MIEGIRKKSLGKNRLLVKVKPLLLEGFFHLVTAFSIAVFGPPISSALGSYIVGIV